jgi:hypothetical protein
MRAYQPMEVVMKKKLYIKELQENHLKGAEILARDTRIKLSHSGKTESASIIGKSAIYGVFAITKDNVRYVHRTNGPDIAQYTWY